VLLQALWTSNAATFYNIFNIIQRAFASKSFVRTKTCSGAFQYVLHKLNDNTVVLSHYGLKRKPTLNRQPKVGSQIFDQLNICTSRNVDDRIKTGAIGGRAFTLSLNISVASMIKSPPSLWVIKPLPMPWRKAAEANKSAIIFMKIYRRKTFINNFHLVVVRNVGFISDTICSELCRKEYPLSLRKNILHFGIIRQV
jgi:hypothetical protein